MEKKQAWKKISYKSFVRVSAPTLEVLLPLLMRVRQQIFHASVLDCHHVSRNLV